MRAPSRAVAAAGLVGGAALGLGVHVLGERTGDAWALVDDVVAGVVLAVVLLVGTAVLRRGRGGAGVRGAPAQTARD